MLYSSVLAPIMESALNLCGTLPKATLRTSKDPARIWIRCTTNIIKWQWSTRIWSVITQNIKPWWVRVKCNSDQYITYHCIMQNTHWQFGWPPVVGYFLRHSSLCSPGYGTSLRESCPPQLPHAHLLMTV